MKRLIIKNGIRDGFPIFIGYFPIAIAFSVLAKSGGLSLIQTFVFSCALFAGASQFVAVGMIGMGAGLLEIVVTVFFLNFRYFLMSSSLANRVQFSKPFWKCLAAYFITDETFAVASFKVGDVTEQYLLPMELTAYLGWISGTAAGYLLGEILPIQIKAAVGIGLYAMFVAILMPQVKKTINVLWFALAGGIVHTLLRWAGLSAGFGIVLAIIICAGAGSFLLSPEETKGKEPT